MINAAVLAAIARAVEQGGDVEQALDALRRADPLVRGPARRRLRAAHADARMATRVKQGPEGGRHTLRLAYLLVARALPPAAARDDVGAVEAAYGAARSARRASRPGFWWPTALAAVALAAVGGVSAMALGRPAGRAPAPASSAAGERPPPAVRGAFETGGVPAPSPGDAVIARALGTDAPDFFIALDHRSEAQRAGALPDEATAEMKKARELTLAPEVREALGPGATRALDALLVTAGAASGDVGSGDAFAAAAAALDDELAAQGLGYFVDGEVLTDTESSRRLVLLYTFRVARVSVFSAGPPDPHTPGPAGATTVRALSLRRLDKLNWSHTLLGFTRPALRAAVVLLNQLDEQVLTRIAPAIEAGAAMPLFEPEAAAGDRAAIEARAGALVREEYGALPGLDTAAAARLGKLLGARHALFARWERLAAAKGMALVEPAKLRLPEGFARSLAGLVPRDDLAELARIDAALDDRTRADAFRALRDALAASVERHEVQHRLDAAGRAPPMPRALEARVGPLEHAGEERRLASTARAELSAYLAELARDPHTPRVGLTLIARFLFDQRMHGAPECYAALTIFEGLTEALGLRAGAPLLAGRTIDRRAVASAWLSLTALPPERLRSAARELWETLFGAPLAELHEVGPTREPPR